MEGDYFNGPLSEPEDAPVVHFINRTFTNENSRVGLYKRNLLVENVRRHLANN